MGIEVNEKFDKCAVIGSSLSESMACNDFQTSLITVANKMDDWALREIAISRTFRRTAKKNSELAVFSIRSRDLVNHWLDIFGRGKIGIYTASSVWYPVLRVRRLKFLGKHTFPLMNCVRFVKSAGWFFREWNVKSSK